MASTSPAAVAVSGPVEHPPIRRAQDRLHIRALALRAVFDFLFDRWSRGGLRFDGEFDAAYAGGWMGPTLRIDAGSDFEALLESPARCFRLRPHRRERPESRHAWTSKAARPTIELDSWAVEER